MQQPDVAYTAGTPGHTTVVVQPATKLSSSPQQLFCPTCNRPVITKAVKQNGLLVWLSCCLLFFLGGPFLCFLIPFCCGAFKDVDHQCPECKASLGIYKRI